MPTRTFAVAAALVGTAALATTGITYASTATTDHAPAAEPAHRAAKAAAPAPHRAAPPRRNPAPAAAAPSRAGEKREEDRGRRQDRNEGRDRDEGQERRHERRRVGRIEFNERTFSAATEGCVIAASGLGSNSFSIFNDSDKTVEVFRGFTCDNGAPVAVVGPHGDTFGVVPRPIHEEFQGLEGLEGYGGFGGRGGLFPDDGVVGSFRVVGHHDDW
jgi:hypothetical protein